MPRNFEFPRARGGRGPQIGPGTFDGRSSPDPFTMTAVAWCPGPDVPGTELWCLHKPTFATIDPGSGQSQSQFLDKVPEPQAFIPPLNSLPADAETIDALKEYARNRRFQVYGEVSALTDWSVYVGQPIPIPLGGTLNRKVMDGVYRVSQPDRVTAYIPLAWVWVSTYGAREIWLYYRPNAPDGFHFVGTQPAGSVEPYVGTEIRYTRIVPAGSAAWDAELKYSASLLSFEQAALADTDTPAGSLDDLIVHDLRVEDHE